MASKKLIYHHVPGIYLKHNGPRALSGAKPMSQFPASSAPQHVAPVLIIESRRLCVFMLLN